MRGLIDGALAGGESESLDVVPRLGTEDGVDSVEKDCGPSVRSGHGPKERGGGGVHGDHGARYEGFHDLQRSRLPRPGLRGEERDVRGGVEAAEQVGVRVPQRDGDVGKLGGETLKRR